MLSERHVVCLFLSLFLWLSLDHHRHSRHRHRGRVVLHHGDQHQLQNVAPRTKLLALFVSFVLFSRQSCFCLCGVVTEMANRIFGQPNRIASSDTRKTICRSTASRQSEDRVHNNDDDDDDDHGVYALHAVVNEERVKVYGPV